MIKQVFALLLPLALAPTALAGEPENIPCRDSKIVLRLDLPWTKPERGHCFQWWAADYKTRHLYARWQGDVGSVVIFVSRLAPGVYWGGGQLKLDRRSLEKWPDLSDLGVSDIQKISCAVDKCLSFSAGEFKCGAFGYLTGWYGDARGDRGTDVVEGYYCSQSGKASEKLDGILQAIDLEAVFPKK